jgi:hypothetical protein
MEEITNQKEEDIVEKDKNEQENKNFSNVIPTISQKYISYLR